jgi:hypothetical protein
MKSREENFERIITLMMNDRSEDAPADALKYARNLFRVHAPEPQPSLLRKIIGVLSIDLAPNMAAFGERSAAGAEARQMMFDADDNAVDLRVSTGTDGLDVRGQILGSGFENGEVEISGDKIDLKSQIDQNGGFSFTGLKAGDYSLNIKGSASDIVIEKFTL